VSKQALTARQQYKRDWLFLIAALLLAVAIPLALVVGSRHIEFLRRQEARVLSLSEHCFVRFKVGSGRYANVVQNVVRCDEVRSNYESAHSSSFRWGNVTEARVEFRYKDEALEQTVMLFHPDSRARAEKERIVWIARLSGRSADLRVIDTSWHSVKFIEHGAAWRRFP
jgi:hypothetical protein